MDLQTILVTLHLIGFAFGVGGATSSDVVFLRAIRNGKVSRDEYNIIKTLSSVVWASVVLLLTSGAMLMALQQYEIGDVPRFGWSFFQLKMVAYAFVIANGIVFHFMVFPLIRNSIGKSFRTQSMKRKYGLFAITGAVSIVSWYTAFLLVAFGRFFIEYSFSALLAGYLTLIAAAAIGAYSVIKLYGDGKGALVDDIKKALIRAALFVALFAVIASAYIIFLT